MSETVSIPSILIAGALIFFAVRYFFLTPSTPTPGRGSGAGFPGARNVDIAKVDQVSQMFPQLDRRAIAWDLSRNGGSVPATTERALAGRGLDVPPPSFHPPNLTPATAASTTSTSTSTARAGSTATPAKGQDLISRYNLSSKLRTLEDQNLADGGADDGGKEGGENDDQEPKASKGWAATKSERAALFAKRREEMILSARKKMEDAARREAKGKGKAVE